MAALLARLGLEWPTASAGASLMPPWWVIGVAVVATFLLANCIAGLMERARDRRLARKVATLAESAANVSTEPIPVTVITGFLGAGKTVLLNKLLADPGGRRICVIENEAGAVSIDHALLDAGQRAQAAAAAAEVVVLANGCMCCTATGPGSELERTLDRLLKLRESGAGAFDYLVVELSGLADPGPIISTFVRPDVAARFFLDGVVAVCDAKHLAQHLTGEGWAARTSEASRQVGYADIILLNKIDAATAEQAAAAEAAIRQLNPAAALHRCSFCAVPTEQLLDVGAFDVEGASSQLLGALESGSAAFGAAQGSCSGAGCDSQAHAHAHAHGRGAAAAGDGTNAASVAAAASSVASAAQRAAERCSHGDTRAMTLLPAGPLRLPPLRAWLQGVVGAHWRRLFRVKGILWAAADGQGDGDVDGDAGVAGGRPLPRPFLVHGVHADLQGGFEDAGGALSARPGSFTPALVLIGRGFSAAEEARLREEFAALPVLAVPAAGAPALAAASSSRGRGTGGAAAAAAAAASGSAAASTEGVRSRPAARRAASPGGSKRR